MSGERTEKIDCGRFLGLSSTNGGFGVDWLINKWDWFVYRLARSSITRICERHPGMAYLFELWFRDWNEKNPISKELASATEHFFESVRDASVQSTLGPTGPKVPEGQQ